ncbi:hypothetical protein Tco_0525721 [Tanacetum coccineum]
MKFCPCGRAKLGEYINIILQCLFSLTKLASCAVTHSRRLSSDCSKAFIPEGRPSIGYCATRVANKVPTRLDSTCRVVRRRHNLQGKYLGKSQNDCLIDKQHLGGSTVFMWEFHHAVQKKLCIGAASAATLQYQQLIVAEDSWWICDDGGGGVMSGEDVSGWWMRLQIYHGALSLGVLHMVRATIWVRVSDKEMSGDGGWSVRRQKSLDLLTLIEKCQERAAVILPPHMSLISSHHQRDDHHHRRHLMSWIVIKDPSSESSSGSESATLRS